jgi:hypothetical protein
MGLLGALFGFSNIVQAQIGTILNSGTIVQVRFTVHPPFVETLFFGRTFTPNNLEIDFRKGGGVSVPTLSPTTQLTFRLYNGSTLLGTSTTTSPVSGIWESPSNPNAYAPTNRTDFTSIINGTIDGLIEMQVSGGPLTSTIDFQSQLHMAIGIDFGPGSDEYAAGIGGTAISSVWGDVGKPITITGISTNTAPGPSRSGVVSHIAAGGGWTTVATLVNTSSTAVPVTVSLHRDDGSALSLPVTTTQQGISQTTTTSSVSATINPNATLLISMGDQLPSLSVGWADVLSIGSLGGYAIFRQTPQTGSPSEGTVPLQSQFPSTVTLPYDNTAGFVMGVALANLSASSASVVATMWDDSGNQLGTQNLTIAGNGHTAFVLPTQLALTAGRRGIVKFQTSGGIAGLGLRFSPFGTFTSVPTM